jgi:hypothetical protein
MGANLTKAMNMTPTPENIRIVATAIANSRAMRRGCPPIGNILDILPRVLLEEVTEDAKAAMEELSETFVHDDTRRLDWLERAIPGMPDMAITQNHDLDEEDALGTIPEGWNIRVPSSCAKDLMFNAPTLRTVIDAAMEDSK